MALLAEISKFYKSLYSVQKTEENKESIQTYLTKIDLSCKLSEDDKNYCDKELSEIEITNAVSKLKKNKSPGLDGITPEFYQKFWNKLKPYFIDMIHESFIHGELPDTLRKSVIALIYKKNDKELLKNYRPISLSNYDYKILAFVLASRMQKVIHKLVHKDQTGYIKGRYIGCNARLIKDIFEYSDDFNIDGALVCLDYEKAFDSLNWNFMLMTLQKFNFGEHFIKWIKILYTNPLACIKNNGWISKEFKLERGIRQGCPVSALVFILAVEIMAVKIREDENIEGFTFGKKEIKLSQYADDTTLILSNIQSVTTALHIITEFSKYSGLKLNLDKCEAVGLGQLKNYNGIFAGIRFTQDPIKCIGIFVGHNKDKCNSMNWDDKISKFEKQLNHWKMRKLTLFGKILILKSLGISTLIYNMSILETNCEVVKRINKITYDFIWRKKDRIKRKTIIGSIEKGGINMIDIESKIDSLKASWAPRLINTDHPWKYILEYYLEKSGLRIIDMLRCNVTCIKQLEKLKIPKFYKDVLLAFNKCKHNKSVNFMNNDEVLSEVWWLNEKLIDKGKVLFFKEWIFSKFIYIKDLFDKNGEFIDAVYVLDTLKDKRNWITQYSVIKKIVMKMVKTYKLDTTKCKYINADKNCISLIENNNRHVIREQKSNFFYTILVEKRFVKPCMQRAWCKKFNLDEKSIFWDRIYTQKIKHIEYKKFAEFNFKLIHNILPCGFIVSKWNNNVTQQCGFCGEIETLQHMIFDCERIHEIWRLIESTLKTKVSYKHIVLGYYENENTEYIFRNVLFTIVAFSIFSKWCEFSEDNSKFKNVNMKVQILKNIKFYTNVLEYVTKERKLQYSFENFVKYQHLIVEK